MNTSKKVTIIGGYGRMGRFFTQQLITADHNVKILEYQDWDRASTLLSDADLVLISVPIENTIETIERAAKYLAKETALADITSIKTTPVQGMLEHHRGPVMGLHPMFGPTVSSFAGQKVVVCPGRNDDSFQWLLDLISCRNGEIVFSTPEEHDRMMTIVQATSHFYRFSLGVFLAQESIDIDRSLSMSSPNYRQEIDIVKRLFTQNPQLCADIMLATQERSQAIECLANTYSRLAKLVAAGNREGLIREFEIVQSFFTQQKEDDYCRNTEFYSQLSNIKQLSQTKTNSSV